MVDDTNTQKRRTLGSIPTNKFSKIAEWKQFELSAREFAEVKAKLTASKNRFRETLRKHSPALSEIESLEFQVTPDRREIVCYELMKPARRQSAGKRNELDFE
jgi:hypothetical protein